MDLLEPISSILLRIDESCEFFYSSELCRFNPQVKALTGVGFSVLVLVWTDPTLAFEGLTLTYIGHPGVGLVLTESKIEKPTSSAQCERG